MTTFREDVIFSFDEQPFFFGNKEFGTIKL